jgi:uncharacterized protein YcgI (DUF1989 family)
VLGYKTVGGGRDHDVLTTDSRPTYTQIRLCASDAPITMQNFEAAYGNGGRQSFSGRRVINAGTCTRNIDLQDGPRHIIRVDLRDMKLHPGSRAPLVRVMGR